MKKVLLPILVLALVGGGVFWMGNNPSSESVDGDGGASLQAQSLASDEAEQCDKQKACSRSKANFGIMTSYLTSVQTEHGDRSITYLVDGDKLDVSQIARYAAGDNSIQSALSDLKGCVSSGVPNSVASNIIDFVQNTEDETIGDLILYVESFGGQVEKTCAAS